MADCLTPTTLSLSVLLFLPCSFLTIFRQFLSDLASFLPDFVVCLLSVSFFLLLTTILFFLCFVSRSFFFLHHFSVFVSRCSIPTKFRKLYPTLFAFSVVLCLTSRLSNCPFLSFFHCISSLLSDFACFLFRS